LKAKHGKAKHGKTKHRKSHFTRMAETTARGAGRPATFIAAVAVIVIWAVSGPMFGYSDTWQLVINTGTTIVTVLMVFLIQNTQNRDSQAVQMKLDELIRAHEGAHNSLLDLEELEVEDLDKLRKEYEGLAKKARETLGDKREEEEEQEQEQEQGHKSKRKPKSTSKRDDAA
jgi:low affinity Fe/Cu permease